MFILINSYRYFGPGVNSLSSTGMATCANMGYVVFPFSCPSYVVLSFYSALHVGTAIGEQEHPTFPDKSKVLLFCPSCWHSHWRAETSHFPGQVQGAAQVQGPPESGFLSVFLTSNNIFLSLTDTFLLTIIPPSMEQFLTTQLWACLCTAPDGQKNSVYSSILPTHEAVEDSCPPFLCPSLQVCVQSSNHPHRQI